MMRDLQCSQIMIVIVEGIVMVVEQRYDIYSWYRYVLLVDGGSRIGNQISYSQGRDVDARDRLYTSKKMLHV